jgi:hypothetical protein
LPPPTPSFDSGGYVNRVFLDDRARDRFAHLSDRWMSMRECLASCARTYTYTTICISIRSPKEASWSSRSS